MNKYDVQEIIGEGTYGIVVKALNKETNEIVAIKKFKDNARLFIKRELKMLNSLKSCEFIINLKEAFRRNEKIYFIFEYVERTVLELLAEYPNGISQNICKSITFQLCKAIEKCHSLNIVHRDIKPENLLIDRSYHLKLCDFGFARPSYQEGNECFTEYVATRWYRAPELLLVCPYGKPVDIWAIGCMVCEMTIGRPLFEGKSDLDQLQKIKSSLGQIAEFQLDELQKTGKQSSVKIMKQSNELFTFERKFSDMNEKLFDFTKRCLTVNPIERLSIGECLKHPALEIQLKVYLNKLSGSETTPGKNLRPKISEKRGNIKSFKSLMIPRNPSRLEKVNSFETTDDPPRLRSHLTQQHAQKMTPQQTGITDIRRNEELLSTPKQTFPLLSYNTNPSNIKRYSLGNKHEQLFQHQSDMSLTAGETDQGDKTQPVGQRKGQVNRAATIISHYGANIFQQPRSYQSENKDMKQINYLKLLNNRKNAANLKHRSKSTIGRSFP